MINSKLQMNKNSSSYLSPLAVWALAFGCSVGWGAFVMPGTTFLPIAGPLGSVIGLLIGALFMLVIGYNYHRLMQRYPDSGGAFSYTKNILGGDHGFLCAWMLLLTYIAIIWANATAISLFVRFLFGDVLCFGFSYQIAGYTVYTGEILASAGLIALTCLVCAVSKQIAKWVQTVCAVILFVGVLACFIAVVVHRGGFSGIAPLFSQVGDPAVQIIGIVVLAPWAFIGFESISHSAGEFRFSVKKSLPIIIIAITTGFLAYAMLSMCASMAHPDGYNGWVDYIKALADHNGVDYLPTFFSAKEAMGETGLVMIAVSALCGIITGMIGHMIALSRLICSLSDEGLMPQKLKQTNKRGVPWIAVCCIAVVSSLILFLGRTAIGWIVDVTTVGATIVYAYTSICAVKDGKRENHKPSLWFGVIGTIFSLIIIIVYLTPILRSQSQLPTESLMILILWSVLGIVTFRFLIRGDKSRKYGKSFIVWIILFFLILFVSVIWANKATTDEAASISSRITSMHIENAVKERFTEDEVSVHETNEYATAQIEKFGSDIRKNLYILSGLILFSLVIIFSIFTEIKRREKDIEAERLHAEESSRAKSNFLSNMSHDIRTPLNAVTGYTSLALQEEDIPDQIRDYLEKIDYSSKHLLSLINDILDMSRIESGKVELDFSNTDLFEMFDEIYDIFSLQMKTKSLEFTVDYDAVDNRYVICDKNRLVRILLNLISNAYKFTPEGGMVSVVIEQTGYHDGKAEYTMCVSDSGIGMSPEFVGHIFDAFERERTSTVSQLQGTGLGMSIAKSFVELMGGTISVETAPNEGTSFTVSLHFPVIDESAMESKSGGESKEIAVSGKRLLIVEDNPINCEIANEFLTRAGFETEIAENGEVAVKMVTEAEAGYYDAVLMDIMMPVMDGFEATRQIRALKDKRAEVPIIAVSANTFESDKKQAIEIGMNAHVSKPYDPDKLIAAINKVIQ